MWTDSEEFPLLKDLIEFSLDGEWGKDTPFEDSECMYVIRGTDFEAVNYGDLSSVPLRYVAKRHADRKALKPNDILIETAGGSKDNPTGRTVLLQPRLFQKANYRVTCASFARFIRIDKQKAVPAYVYWVLQNMYSSGVMAVHQVQHTGVARFQYTRFAESVRIPLLQKADQLGVVDFLGALQGKIEINRQINQTLEQIAQAIFKSWFVDFDPVRVKVAAKEEGRDPLRAAMSAISGKDDNEQDVLPVDQHEQLTATAALFPDEMEASELEEIPKGWETMKIEAILERLSSHVRYSKSQVSEYGAIPVFEQGSGVLLGFHDVEAQITASPENPAFIFGDHTCIMHLSCEPFNISQNVIPLRGKGRPTLWVYYAVKDKQKFQEYRRHWMELITKDVVVPPQYICDAFVQRVTTFHICMEANDRQCRTLAALRDILLPKLLSGELSVIPTKRRLRIYE